MSGLNERVNNWLKSAEKPVLCSSDKKHNTYEIKSASKGPMDRESKIKETMSKQFRNKRYSNNNITGYYRPIPTLFCSTNIN